MTRQAAWVKNGARTKPEEHPNHDARVWAQLQEAWDSNSGNAATRSSLAQSILARYTLSALPREQITLVEEARKHLYGEVNNEILRRTTVYAK